MHLRCIAACGAGEQERASRQALAAAQQRLSEALHIAAALAQHVREVSIASTPSFKLECAMCLLRCDIKL